MKSGLNSDIRMATGPTYKLSKPRQSTVSLRNRRISVIQHAKQKSNENLPFKLYGYRKPSVVSPISRQEITFSSISPPKSKRKWKPLKMKNSNRYTSPTVSHPALKKPDDGFVTVKMRDAQSGTHTGESRCESEYTI